MNVPPSDAARPVPQRVGSAWAELVRPRRDGGFFALVLCDNVCCSVLRTRYVDLGLGDPALRLVTDLQRYRAQHGDGFPTTPTLNRAKEF
jgi:hypothetical protein